MNVTFEAGHTCRWGRATVYFALATREEGQPIVEVGPIDGAAKVAPSAPSYVLTKRKHDDSARKFGCKKSRAPLSFHALRQAARLTSCSGHPSSLQDVPPNPPTIEAPTSTIVVDVTSAFLPWNPPPLRLLLHKFPSLS